MSDAPSYILTCIICGRRMNVPAQYLDRVLAKFKCQKCKSTRPPVVQAE
jgi:transposase-like protein